MGRVENLVTVCSMWIYRKIRSIIFRIGSLTVTNKQLDEKKNKLQAEITSLEKKKVGWDSSVKTLSSVNQKICNSILVKGPQRDALAIIIQEKEAEVKKLNQSLLLGWTTIFEANLIVAFLVSPKVLNDYHLDKLVRLMVALRQKRLGVALEQGRDAEGNLTCQCTIPVIGNLDAKDIDMDVIRNQLALHLMPLVKDKFITIWQHQVEVIESHTSGVTAML